MGILTGLSDTENAFLGNDMKIPILIMHGSTDIQMDMDNAMALAKANRLAKMTVIHGMNHILKKVSGNLQEQVSSYGDPSLPVSEELVEEIQNFIKPVEAK